MSVICNWLNEKKVPLERVQELVGHKWPGTREKYIKVESNSERELINKYFPLYYFLALKSFTLVQLLYICIMKKQRTIIFYKDYFEEFFEKQRDKVKSKIIWTLQLVEELERIPETYLKHIENTDGLFEIRVQQGSDIFRIFCFFDEGQLIVLTNGFQKKTQKTPKNEIERAIKIKNEYENEK